MTKDRATNQTNIQSNLKELIAKIDRAAAFTKNGKIEQAKAIYQEIASQDAVGILGASAKDALESLDRHRNTSPTQHSRWRWFYNLSIDRKQISALMLVEILTVVAMISSIALLRMGLRSQLMRQSQSELAILEMSYKTKINEITFGFRGLSKNPLAIEAVQTGKTNPHLYRTLWHEIWMRKIEFATLVDTKFRIIERPGISIRGSQFNPHNLVAKAIKKREQIKSTEVISYTELAAESPRFAQLRAQEMGLDPAEQPNFLIRYIVTPIENTNGVIIGALIAGDIVKNSVASHTNRAFQDGYSAVHLISANDQFTLATSQAWLDDGTIETNLNIFDRDLLTNTLAAQGQIVNQWIDFSINSKSTTYAVSAKLVNNFAGKPIAILVRGSCSEDLENLFLGIFAFQALLICLVICLKFVLAKFLSTALVKPIHRLRESTLRFANGERNLRAKVFASDEIGELATTFNTMADSIAASETEKEAQAFFQTQEKERIQQSIHQLLSQIAGAKTGNLTVRASVEDGEIGSIADAFNTTIESLREIVIQVQNATTQVQDSVQDNEITVEKLNQEATKQVEAISETMFSVEEMAASIQLVANSATEAADIAHQALKATQIGDEMMSQTVDNINNIRVGAGETAKKMKRLAESSQEISQIVAIISGISEKTNLLAFNASIEASRAGENGQGFRIVADEVRRLAERVTDATKNIEELVNTIQQDTAEVLNTMEKNTTQVVAGTHLVNRTKETLQELAQISHNIDRLLQSISTSTVYQAEYSQIVTQTMQELVTIAQNTFVESQTVSSSLGELVGVANILQNSVSCFQVERQTIKLENRE